MGFRVRGHETALLPTTLTPIPGPVFNTILTAATAECDSSKERMQPSNVGPGWQESKIPPSHSQSSKDLSVHQLMGKKGKHGNMEP